MAEKDLTLKFKVTDEGTVVLDKISSNIQKIDKSVSSMNTSLGGIKAASIVYLGQMALAAANEVYDFSRAIASVGNDIQRMSRTFNMSTGDFQKWSYVTKMADVNIEEFGQGFKFLTRSMSETLQGTGDAAKAFNLLGINLKDATGNTKDQQTVMMEVIQALGKYSDGVNRDALMLAIFGRGWMSIKPLVDQGTKAIQDNMKESERLGIILGKDLVKALSESENVFKRWEATFKIARVETFTPMVEILGNMLERIMSLKRAWAEGGIGGVYKDILAAQEEQRISKLPAAAWTKEWIAGWTPPAEIKKPEAPAIIDLAKYYKDQKDFYDSISKNAEMLEKLANPEFAAFWEILKGMDVDIIKLNKDTDAWFATVQENMKEFHYEAPKEGAWTEMGLTQAEFEYYQRTAKTATEARKEWAEAYSEVTGLEGVWKGFGDTLSSVWSENVSGMIKGTTTFKDAFENMAKGMADSFISSITKMISQWLLFGSVTGKREEGGSFLTGGSWSGLLGSIVGLLGEGGITGGMFAHYPLYAYQAGGIARSPQIGIFGEGGAEAFVPLKGGKIPVETKGGGKGDTYITNTYIEATDVNSFMSKYGNAIESVYYKGRRFNKVSMR